jgi:hypothetical protein
MSSGKTFSRLLLAGSFAALTVATAAFAHDGNGNGNGDGHDFGNNDLPLYLTRTLDATAQDSASPGNLWVGSGIPATNFLAQVNTPAGIELAIKGMIRQGGDILPTYVDGDGIVHVQVPSGAQPANPARAAWNFTYSVNASLPGAAATLDAYEAHLQIDLDPSEGTRYLDLKLARVGAAGPGPEPDTNGFGWVAGNTVVIGDDEGTQRVTQNSQNYAFYASIIDSDRTQQGLQPYTFGPAQFDVELSLRAKFGPMRGRDVARVHVIFDVVDP